MSVGDGFRFWAGQALFDFTVFFGLVAVAAIGLGIACAWAWAAKKFTH